MEEIIGRLTRARSGIALLVELHLKLLLLLLALVMLEMLLELHLELLEMLLLTVGLLLLRVDLWRLLVLQLLLVLLVLKGCVQSHQGHGVAPEGRVYCHSCHCCRRGRRRVLMLAVLVVGQLMGRERVAAGSCLGGSRGRGQVRVGGHQRLVRHAALLHG